MKREMIELLELLWVCCFSWLVTLFVLFVLLGYSVLLKDGVLHYNSRFIIFMTLLLISSTIIKFKLYRLVVSKNDK